MITIENLFHPHLNLIAYRVERTECHPLEIRTEDRVDRSSMIKTYSLVLSLGGFLKIDGVGFIPLDAPGLYRIYRLNDAACVQWIVRDDDTITFAASVATIFYHQANEPPDLTSNTWSSMQKMHEYFLSNASNGKVGGVCITAANSFALLCQEFGIDAVLWEFQDMETRFTPVRTHAMTEFRDPTTKKRVLVDIDRKFILQDKSGEPLNCLDYVHYAIGDRPFDIVPISKAKVAGFGATERIPMVMDFEEELVDLADDVYRQEIVRSIGKSILIKGTRYYDGTTVFTLPGLPERIKEFLASDAANGISDRDRTAFESVLQYPVSEF